jgi:hypothetical protein
MLFQINFLFYQTLFLNFYYNINKIKKLKIIKFIFPQFYIKIYYLFLYYPIIFFLAYKSKAAITNNKYLLI